MMATHGAGEPLIPGLQPYVPYPIILAAHFPNCRMSFWNWYREPFMIPVSTYSGVILVPTLPTVIGCEYSCSSPMPPHLHLPGRVVGRGGV